MPRAHFVEANVCALSKVRYPVGSKNQYHEILISTTILCMCDNLKYGVFVYLQAK